MPTESNANRPSPPPEIQDEALIEWHRVCDELSQAGRLDKADRAILVLYCQTWDVYQQAMRGVTAHGAIVKFGNGIPGRSPFYTVAKESANQLQKLLSDLGLTPAARQKIKAAAEVPAEMDF